MHMQHLYDKNITLSLKMNIAKKRAEILEKLIDGTTTSEDVATTGSGNSNASLFRSTKMKDELEQRAIDNLRREIAILRSGSIPGQ
mmetsp:Transcript_23924/g.33580  ORF Transcript_23924/g.33580 Transcript_23924/m.33580 type:complete len:86 (+) Transcript_23924:3-260(+)